MGEVQRAVTRWFRVMKRLELNGMLVQKLGGGVFGVLVLGWFGRIRRGALLIQFNSCSALRHFSELVLLAG